MAQVSGTYSKYDAVGLREDLTDIIYNISPTDTPFMSSIAKTKATAVNHEWQLDSLAAASGSNAQIEGNEVTFSTPTATTRKSNVTQISTKSVVISGTLEAVNKAVQDLSTLLAPNGALCTTWILITEWVDTDGNFWFSSHAEPDQPVWRQSGMLDHAKSYMIQKHYEGVINDDD